MVKKTQTMPRMLGEIHGPEVQVAGIQQAWEAREDRIDLTKGTESIRYFSTFF